MIDLNIKESQKVKIHRYRSDDWAIINIIIISMFIGITGWIALLVAIYLYKKVKDERLKSITIEEKENTDPKIVVIGGGTGQSVFLRGLKQKTHNIKANAKDKNPAE